MPPITFQRLFRAQTSNVVVQLFRYGLVGAVAFIVDFGLLYFFTEYCGIPYLISASLSFLAGLAVNYLLSIKWVFNSKATADGGSQIIEFLLFAVIGVIGLGLNAFLLWLFTEECSFYYLVSKLFSTVIVFGWNFVARRILTSNFYKYVK